LPLATLPVMKILFSDAHLPDETARHAHSVYSPDERNRPLSERGRIDAQKVAEILKDCGVDVLIASPYRRAFQTIEGLAKLLEKEIVIEEDIRERLLSAKPVDDFESAV